MLCMYRAQGEPTAQDRKKIVITTSLLAMLDLTE